MVNELIVVILVVVMFIALRSSVKHFAGQGGCCGGGSTVKPKKKKLSGVIVCRMSATIEGMHCENCTNKIEGKINDIDGVACRVNLKKKEALITATREISEDEIRKTIAGLGYEVTDVKRKQKPHDPDVPWDGYDESDDTEQKARSVRLAKQKWMK